MPELYVSGPVIRQSMEWDLAPWVQEIYTQLSALAHRQGKTVILPNAEPQLEHSDPKEFFRAIRKRIGSAKAVVSVFAAGDVSAGIETCMASVAGKKIVLIAEDPSEIPRLLEGLPGIVNVLSSADSGEQLESAILQLLGPRPGNSPNSGRRPR
jgi:hypothetical protein